MKKNKIIDKICPHCQGKGYTEIRDCSGEIQREETCVFCAGTPEQGTPEQGTPEQGIN
jgi:DnaJ-class molecular chaperone